MSHNTNAGLNFGTVCSECKDKNPDKYFTVACITKMNGAQSIYCDTCNRMLFEILDNNPNAELFMV